MDFSTPRRKPSDQNLLPMINVVFLLLIFFLISARLTPPEPFAVIPPKAQTEAEARGDFTIFIAADGQIGYRDSLAEAALTEITASRDSHCATNDCEAEPPRLTLRADNSLPAVTLAALLPKLSALGFSSIELVAEGGDR